MSKMQEAYEQINEAIKSGKMEWEDIELEGLPPTTKLTLEIYAPRARWEWKIGSVRPSGNICIKVLQDELVGYIDICEETQQHLFLDHLHDQSINPDRMHIHLMELAHPERKGRMKMGTNRSVILHDEFGEVVYTILDEIVGDERRITAVTPSGEVIGSQSVKLTAEALEAERRFRKNLGS